MKVQLGAQMEDFMQAMQSPIHTSIRLHPSKKASQYDFELNDPVDWCDEAYFLKERPVFTLDPIFHGGGYYVQEPSSMLIENSIKKHLEPLANPMVLDLCAAPGGKSTSILSVLKGKGILVSNELISGRVHALQHNLIKWGYTNRIITQADPVRFKALPGFFDLILVDAPCSGEGLFRKDMASRKEWNEHSVNQCSSRQRRILSDTMDALKPEGILVYSTCTYNPAENMEQVQWMHTLGLESEPSPELDRVDVVKMEQGQSIGYQAYPHLIKGEGFFISILRKKSGQTMSNHKTENQKVQWCTLPDQGAYLVDPENGFAYFKHHEMYFAFPESRSNTLDQCSELLRIIEAGCALGQLKNKDCIPAHSWAQNLDCSKSVETLVFEKDQALQYLRKNSLPNVDKKSGFQRIQFRGLALGWAKGLQDRLNNLYPNSYRILMNG